MGLFNSIRMGASGAEPSYTIDRSLRFNPDDGTYLQRTYGSAGNRRTFTLSVWMKRPKLGRNNDLWTPYRGGDGSNESRIQIQDDDQMRIYDSGGSSGYPVVRTKAKLRDTGAWYHLVYAIDTTQATDSNRVKLYINGVHQEVDTSGFHQWPNQNIELGFNNNHYHRIAAYGQSANASDAPGNLSSEYLAEFYVIDGQQLTPATFAETNADTGQWMPKNSADVKAAVTFGTNGFYLNFSDNSDVTATTLGKDYSGNGNNWTPYNFSVSAGEGNDSLEDTPTNNFCTMNPLVASPSVTWKNGNLDLAGTSSTEYSQNNTSTFGVSSGKWYAEVKYTNDGTTNTYVGICPITTSATTNCTGNVTDAAVLRMSNETYIEGSDTQNIFPSGISSGNIIGIALDMDNQKLWFSVQGTYANSGNPATGANAIFSGITAGETMAICARPLSGTLNFNFGQRPFAYTPPTGFKTLCSANLSDPTIKLPNEHFNTILYTGNDSSSRDITGVGFQPDFVWIKNRSQADFHHLVDAVRGANKVIYSNDTDNEQTDNANGHVNSFLADGFNVDAGGSGNVNENNEDYVAWNWNAGGSTVTNNDGSISSQVRANTTAGFSIVTYTGTGSVDTVGHGLGVAPQVVFTRSRSHGGSWGSLHTVGDPTAENRLHLNDNGGYSSYQGNYLWNDTVPTSSVFTVKQDNSTNASSRTYVAYVFSEVAGYSKFGKYTGNGSSDGTFIFTGFRPAWFVVKRTDASNNWRTFDAKRSTFNEVDKRLYLDTGGAESTGSDIDFLSNGVKMRMTDNGMNASGGTYIYYAFAESPFKYSRAR